MKTILSVVIALVFSIGLVQAQEWELIQRTVLLDSLNLNNTLNTAVDISGDYVIVGNFRATDAGMAYIYKFENDTWSQMAILTDSEGEAGDQFGYSVSIDGDFAIVGAPGDSSARGSVHLYHRENNNWVKQAKFFLEDGEANDRLGSSVSISGDYAIAGAPNALDPQSQGSTGDVCCFHYENSTWIKLWQAYVSIDNTDQECGGTVSISGDYYIIGKNISLCKSERVFKCRIGNDLYRLTSLVPTECDCAEGVDTYFGESATIDNNTIAVQQGGTVIMYTLNESKSVVMTQIIEDESGIGSHISTNVSVSGDYAVFGTGVYHLNNTMWSKNTDLVNSDGLNYVEDGQSVSISGNTIVFAARLNSHENVLYFYKANPSPEIITNPQVSDITQSSAICGGEVTNDKQLEITAQGICWNTNGLPTINDSKTSECRESASFSSELTGLDDNTTYFVRAYASNNATTVYGDQVTFTTSALSIAIKNSAKISDTQYTFTSEINNPDSIEIVDKGIVWGSNEEPTVFDHIGKVRSGDGSDLFTAEATGMFANSSFYVRSYITTYQGTYYSDQIHFGVVPILPNWALMLLASGFIVTAGWFVFRKFM